MIVLQKRSCTSMIIRRSAAPAVHHTLWLRRTHCWCWRPIRPYPSTPPHRSAPPSQSEPAKAVATHQTHHGHRAHTSPQQRRLRWLHQPNWRRACGARASASIAIIPTEPASRPVVAPRLGRRAGHRASGSSPTTEVTARAHIARARSDLVIKTEAPPEITQGVSRWPRRAVERQRARCITRCTPSAGGLGSCPSDQHSA